MREQLNFIQKSILDYGINQENLKKERETFFIETPKSKRKIRVELFNFNRANLSTVRKVICVHPANHSVSLFLKMKDKADLCLYCHPLLAFSDAKEHVIRYTQKFKYPLAILTREENIEEFFRTNGVPTKFRRWCTRIFKIETTLLFYKTFFQSGILEFVGIQKFQSKEREKMNPEKILDKKSQKRFKIYCQLPIFYETEKDNLERMEQTGIESFNHSIRSFNRYGCFLCPFAGERYYRELKIKCPEIYKCCEELMVLGSGNEKRYYYYPKSKIM
ncbi:MAG: phosphoadenosine phosphosulfate reductase domain-containing protein [Promethearchaeota archaeon]